MTDASTYLVSYPKSGNTWTRFLFANVLAASDQRVDFQSIVHIVPEWEQRSRENDKPARIYKSHSAFDASFERVVYIVRDPRAVYLSYFHFFRKHLDEKIDSIEALVAQQEELAFGPWQAHVLSWYGRPGTRFFKYEDLASDPASTFEQMLAFTGVQASDNQVENALRRSSFQNMAELEQAYGRPFLDEESRRKASPFMRSGKADAWRQELKEREQRLIVERNAKAMALLGYLG